MVHYALQQSLSLAAATTATATNSCKHLHVNNQCTFDGVYLKYTSQ